MKKYRTQNSISLLKPLLLLSLISLSFSGLVFPGKKIPILAEDTVVEVTDPKLRRASAGVPMGRRLVIKLKGDVDSGKGWYIRNFSKSQKELLVPQNINSFNSGEFICNQDQLGKIQHDGFYYFIFKPRKVGKIVLSFSYRRPFQWDSSKNPSFRVSVRVLRNAFDDTIGLQNDHDAKRIYNNFQRKQKVKRSSKKTPNKTREHIFKGFNHKYTKFGGKCHDGFDF